MGLNPTDIAMAQRRRNSNNVEHQRHPKKIDEGCVNSIYLDHLHTHARDWSPHKRVG